MIIRPLAALLVATPLVAAACGGASSSPVSQPGTATPVTRAPASPSQYVLHVRDVGYGYIPVSTQTGAVSLTDELASDTSARARRVDRASFRGGYKSLFATAAKVGVLSVADEYATASAAATSYHDPVGVRSLVTKLRGRRLAVPAEAPGSDPIIIAGHLPESGTIVPAYTILWRHGPVLNSILLFGPAAGVSQSHLVALAQRQDDRLAAAGL